jgi:hypothetical protein
MSLADLEASLRGLNLELERRAGARDVVEAALERQESEAAKAAEDAETCRKGTEVLLAAIETRRKDLRDRVESLVTRGLRAVFRRADMEFFFEARTHGGTVGILPALRSTFKGKPIEVGIVEGHGGGVADVISFLLRVVVLSLARPRLALVLVLDEPFRHVSLEYLRGCATLLRELNRTAGVQFILVTHKPDLLDAADVVYRTAVENGTTRFEIEHDLRDDVFHQKLPEGAKRREPLPEEVGELRLANESVSLREARSAEFSTDVSPRTLAARVNFAKGREAKKQNELERKRARRRPPAAAPLEVPQNPEEDA